jgi:hypothetical protein
LYLWKYCQLAFERVGTEASGGSSKPLHIIWYMQASVGEGREQRPCFLFEVELEVLVNVVSGEVDNALKKTNAKTLLISQHKLADHRVPAGLA